MQSRVSIFLCASIACAVGPHWLSAANAQGIPLVPAISAPSEQNAPKLIYRKPETPLTIGELSTAQRKKLEDDFFKRAGFTSAQPASPVASVKLRPGLNVQPVKPMHSLVILGVYGPINAQKVDLSFDGEARTLTANSRLSNISIDSIQPGQVVIVYRKMVAQKGQKSPSKLQEVRQTLKPGDVLEIPS